jgi:hypothetical protein
LPEQLLLSAFGSLPDAASAWATGPRRGQCVPHSSARDVEPGLGEHPLDHLDVARLAVVRRAGDRQLLVVEAEPVGGAALDQRDRLQHLDRRARKDRPIDVAERDQPLAVGVETAIAPRCADSRVVAAHRLDEDRDWARDRRSWRPL